MPPFFVEVALLLIFSALIAYAGYRMKLVPIVGFLVTGVVIGPHALGLVANQELVDATAQVGVILLLFTIGIEFSLEKLMRIKRLVFGGGLLQVVLTTGFTLLVLLAFDVPWRAGLFTGFLVALSSTAIVLKLQGSKGETNAETGQASLGILIFQDLSIIVMVLLIPMLAGEAGSAGDIFWALGKAGLIIVIALVGARRIMPFFLERVARTCSQELFLLALIAICFGMALLASLAGVSLELGAFLAGLIVSESRFSEHAFGEILPLQILFAATFFVSVGMLLDIGFLMANLPLVVGIVALVLVLKFFTASFSLKVLGYGLPTSVAVGFYLAQVGEFSFVLERAGRELNLFPAGMGEPGSKVFIAATVVLMVLTPAVSQAGRILAKRMQRSPEQPDGESMNGEQAERPDTLPETHHDLQNHVIIAGYGPSARALSRILKSARIPQIVITLSPIRAQQAEDQGILVLRGDPTRQNALRNARVAYAKLLFVPDDDPELAHRVASVVRTLNPTLRIVARTREEAFAETLNDVGADLILSDDLEMIAQMFAETLRDYQIDSDEIARCVGIVKEERYLPLRQSEPFEVLAPIGAMIRGLMDTRIVTLRERAPIVGKTIEEIRFDEKGLTIKSVKRGHTLVERPPLELTLQPGDHLTLTGQARDFAACSLLFNEHSPDGDEEPNRQIGDGTRPQTFTDGDIHLYGTDWCLLTGGFRAYFKRKGYPFTYHNIEADERARQAVLDMNDGKLKFPMIAIDEVILKNPPIEELEETLAGRGVKASEV